LEVFSFKHRSCAAQPSAAALGVTRQGARKVVARLVARKFVLVSRDKHDARRLVVELAPAGRDYADCVVKVVQALNDEIITDVGAEELEAARRASRHHQQLWLNRCGAQDYRRSMRSM
jgi:DNA-binding MarR family transcriptional regulator